MRVPGLLRFGMKAGVMSSAIYFTVDRGFWKDSETTEQLYEDLQKQIKPYMRPIVDQIPFEIPKLPQAGDVVSTAKTTWNKGVMASCLFLAEFPNRSWEYIKKGSVIVYDKINEQLYDLNEEKKK